MCSELKNDIDFEIAQIGKLLDVHGGLIENARSLPPSPVERSALAAMLHGFYNGVENIFLRILKSKAQCSARIRMACRTS